MASIVSSSIPNTAASLGLSSNLGSYTNDTATVAKNASSLLSGTGSLVLPAFAHISETGERSTGFGDLFYNRIWIIPQSVDLGNLVQDQVVSLEVWNAYFESNDLDGITVEGDDTGIVLTGPATHSFAELESVIYSLAVSLTGAPSINVTYDFAFNGIKTPFPAFVVGERVIPFTLKHNWANSVLEQISAKTDIIPALSGREQRIGLRQAPRRRIEMSYLTLTPQDRASLENLLFGWHGRTFLVPMWQDVSQLQTATIVGDTVFSVDTINKDFDVNEFIYVTDGVHYDILEVDSLTSVSVTTKRGAANAYATGVRIAPARLGVLESKVGLSRLTSDAESMRFAWLIRADELSLNRRSPYTPVTYRGLEVYNVSNDYSQDIALDQEIHEEMVDAEIGLFSKYAIEGVSRRSDPVSSTAHQVRTRPVHRVGNEPRRSTRSRFGLSSGYRRSL
jgi:hypothetical protein